MSDNSRGLFRWTLHDDESTISPGEIVAAGERLSWPRIIGIGTQHVVAMFGTIFLVPLLTGFPPTTTLFFSAISALLFFLITAGRLPPYLGPSFALITPVITISETLGMNYAQGGIIATDATLALAGLIVHFAGVRWIDALMPPVVTGAVMALIGLNLTLATWNNVKTAPLTALITIVSIYLITVPFKDIIGRLSILFGVPIGCGAAIVQNQIDFSAIFGAAWFGLPQFCAPAFGPSALGLFVPVVFVLVAENVGHVKSMSAMTGEDFDDVTGRTLLAGGVSVVLVGSNGDSGTTTYAENIGVMTATRIYSTAVYVVAAFVGLALSLLPKFGAITTIILVGVLGDMGTILYGMIDMLGVRIWVQDRVDLSNPVNPNTTAVSFVVIIADFTWNIDDISFEGITLGTGAAIFIYHVMSWISKVRGTNLEQASLTPAPAGAELESETYATRHRATPPKV